MGYNCTPPDPVLPHVCTPRADAPRSPWCGYCLRKLPDYGDLRIGFAYPYGQGEFHGPTLRERQDRQIVEAKAQGLDPQPVGKRWV